LLAKGLSFRYREHGRLVLQDCSLQIYHGDRILLEGPSGGGKTTLAAVLSGLRVPESGVLLLRGYDRPSLGGEAWRQRVVVAPQFHENHVFTETFGFNLLLGRRWPPTPEDTQEAEAICRELGLDDLLARMPSGWQQMVGESGWQLSHPMASAAACSLPAPCFRRRMSSSWTKASGPWTPKTFTARCAAPWSGRRRC